MWGRVPAELGRLSIPTTHSLAFLFESGRFGFGLESWHTTLSLRSQVRSRCQKRLDRISTSLVPFGRSSCSF